MPTLARKIIYKEVDTFTGPDCLTLGEVLTNVKKLIELYGENAQISEETYPYSDGSKYFAIMKEVAETDAEMETRIGIETKREVLKANRERAANVTSNSRMQRCEMIINEYCNFKCPYCQGLAKEVFADRKRKELTLEEMKRNIDLWCMNEPLKNIRFSGGEPTYHRNIVEIVQYAKDKGIERIAVSRNGANKLEFFVPNTSSVAAARASNCFGMASFIRGERNETMACR